MWICGMVGNNYLARQPDGHITIQLIDTGEGIKLRVGSAELPGLAASAREGAGKVPGAD